MLLEIRAFGQWTEAPKPRGRPPKVDVRDDITALSRLLNSSAITSHMKPWLAAEHARLSRLLPNRDAFRPVPAARPIAPRTLADVPRVIKRLARRSSEGPPDQWTNIVRAAYQTLERAGVAPAERLSLLSRVLVAVFPQWWAPNGSTRRLRALVAYVPSKTTLGRAVSDHARGVRNRLEDPEIRDRFLPPLDE
jgi:hypothetical protein